MVRYFGINLPGHKRIDSALTAIHGIGFKLATQILRRSRIDPTKRCQALQPHETKALREALANSNYQYEYQLRRQVARNIDRLISIRAYRGRRHYMKLPSRGQRTQTNAKTRRKRWRI